MAEGQHTPVQQVFEELVQCVQQCIDELNGSAPEDYRLCLGPRTIQGPVIVMHIYRGTQPGQRDTRCSIILDPLNDIVIKIQKTQFVVDDRELKIKPAWDRDLGRSRLYVHYPDDGGRFIFNEDDLEEVARYLLGALP